MRPSKKDAIKRFIKRKGMVRTSEVMDKFRLSKSAVFTYLKKLGALTSFNAKGQYYLLPEHHDFDEKGLKFIGEVGFYEGGNLLAAICRLVEESPCGLGVRELDAMLGTTTHSQLPGLYRSGRLRRESALNRPGRAYVYFSAEAKTAKIQRGGYFSVDEKAPEEPSEDEIAPGEMSDVVEVLLTLIAHPDFSAKSVSLSLQRRGRKITSDFTRRIFRRYGLSQKNS